MILEYILYYFDNELDLYNDVGVWMYYNFQFVSFRRKILLSVPTWYGLISYIAILLCKWNIPTLIILSIRYVCIQWYLDSGPYQARPG